jgi:hypothetical protein
MGLAIKQDTRLPYEPLGSARRLRNPVSDLFGKGLVSTQPFFGGARNLRNKKGQVNERADRSNPDKNQVECHLARKSGGDRGARKGQLLGTNASSVYPAQ